MKSLFFIPEEIARALGWTLAHSLWQGALVALLLAIALGRLTSAKAKYRAAFASLLVVLAAAISTFSMVYDASPKKYEVHVVVVKVAGESPENWQPAIASTSPTDQFLTSLTQILEANFPIAVALWSCGVLFFLLRLAGGLFFLKKICRKASPATSDFQENFERLVRRAAVSRPVQLLETAILKTPATIGWLRPVILMPVGMVNQLSTAEVEAILAHELAHIARHDWLQNFVQALVEVLFFYHPAVWWMSAAVASERENCCDDLALEIGGGSRLGYAKTLLRVQEFSQNQAITPQLALAFAKNQTGLKAIFNKNRPLLLERVRRILQPTSTKKFQVMERLAAAGLVLASLALFAFRAPNPPHFIQKIQAAVADPVGLVAKVVAILPQDKIESEDEIPELIALAQIGLDSLPKPKKYRNYSSDDGDRQVEIRMEHEKVTFLKIDGKEIPAAEYEQHRAMIDKIIAETPIPPAPPAPHFPNWKMWPPDAPDAPDAPHGFSFFPAPPAPPSRAIVSSETDDEGNTTIVMERNGKPSEIVVKKSGEVFVDGKKMEKGQRIQLEEGAGDQTFFWSDDAGNEVIVHGSDVEIAPDGDVRMYKFKKKNYHDKALAEQERAARRSEHAAEAAQQQANLRQHEVEQLARMAEQHTRLSEQHVRLDELRARELAQMHQPRAVRNGGSNFVDVMKNQLHAEGILKDLDNFSIKMSQKSLKVNGKKQSDEVLQRYLELHRAVTGKDFGDSKISIEASN